MEICKKCGEPLKNHGSCCKHQQELREESTGYYWPPGNYGIIDGKEYRIIIIDGKEYRIINSTSSQLVNIDISG